MEVKVKKLSENAKLPTYATEGSCGLDLYSAKKMVIGPSQRACIPTDIAMEIPEGHYGQVGGRSGKFVKEGLLGVTGYVDSDYRKGIGVMVCNTSDSPICIELGERCGQMVILPYPKITLTETDSLSEGSHGDGFGHSGKF